jgi:hypothetical protein
MIGVLNVCSLFSVFFLSQMELLFMLAMVTVDVKEEEDLG